MSKKKLQISKQVEQEQTPAYQKSDNPASESEKTLSLIREIVETFAIAFVLAFLFKTFEGELFGIPTGSMAPTLMGRHKDFNCPECGCPYQVSASEEFNATNNKPTEYRVVAGTCPQCRFTAYVGANNPFNKVYPSFKGDNILVDKYTLNFRQPKRWDVTVFRFPGDPQTSYIKRFAGLENETLQIRNGNLYVKKDGDDQFRIARKEGDHLLAMLQTVYDTRYVNPKHFEAGFPTRWHTDAALNVLHAVQARNRDGSNVRSVTSETVTIKHQNGVESQASGGWETTDNQSFQSTPTNETVWLNYRHCIPTTEDWHQYRAGTYHPEQRPVPPQLITDFTAYNTGLVHTQKDQNANIDGQLMQSQCRPETNNLGVNWVGDLTVECRLTVEQSQGEILFELVAGGVAFDCSIDPATGIATLSIPGNPDFKPLQAQTPVRGTGTWHVMFANVDEQLRLFVNSKEIAFSSDTGYSLVSDRKPTVLDLTPVAIGAKNAKVRVEQLAIKRDIYYIATNGNVASTKELSSCDTMSMPLLSSDSDESLRRVMSAPNAWEHFGKTRSLEIKLGKGEFFALGDNTAKSSDSRMWATGNPDISPYVPEKFLVGEALFVTWPHGHPFPGTGFNIIPNVSKMRYID